MVGYGTGGDLFRKGGGKRSTEAAAHPEAHAQELDSLFVLVAGDCIYWCFPLWSDVWNPAGLPGFCSFPGHIGKSVCGDEIF